MQLHKIRNRFRPTAKLALLMALFVAGTVVPIEARDSTNDEDPSPRTATSAPFLLAEGSRLVLSAFNAGTDAANVTMEVLDGFDGRVLDAKTLFLPAETGDSYSPDGFPIELISLDLRGSHVEVTPAKHLLVVRMTVVPASGMDASVTLSAQVINLNIPISFNVLNVAIPLTGF